MSTSTKHSLGDVLEPEKLEELGKPEATTQVPDAELTEWDDMSAVTAPVSSIAASMDRFRAGNLNPAHANALQGFHGEFTDSGEQVVYVGDELKDLIGDQAYAWLGHRDDTFAVRVESAEEALDVIRKYDEQYTGDVEGEFWNAIESNQFAIPVNYDTTGVVPQEGMVVMGTEDLIMSDMDNQAAMDQILEPGEHYTDGEVNVYTERTPENPEFDYQVDFAFPREHGEVDYRVENGSLIIDSGNTAKAVNNLGDVDIIASEERNGRYTVKLG